MKRRYGWRRQLPDHRDFRFNHVAHLDWRMTPLPPSADLRPGDTPIYDQGQIGSCTANAYAGGLALVMKAAGQPDALAVPSRLFIYYNTRQSEGTADFDSGATIRDTIKAVAGQGACEEAEWPYDSSTLTYEPDEECYANAAAHLVTRYEAVEQSALAIKTALAGGTPVNFGISVFESFESDAVAATGNVPLPDPSEFMLGGHALLLVGYDDSRQVFIVRNSWGASWGDQGYGYLPYAYVLNPALAADFWVSYTVA